MFASPARGFCVDPRCSFGERRSSEHFHESSVPTWPHVSSSTYVPDIVLTRTSVGCGKLCISSFSSGWLSCSALAISVPHLRLPFRTRALSNSASDSRRRAASFPLGSWARTLRADGTRPHVRLWLKKRAADRRAPDRAPTRSVASTSASAAPPRASAAPSGARSRALYTDCDLSYLQTGVFSAPASGVFVRRPVASVGGLPASPNADPRRRGRRNLDSSFYFNQVV